MQCQDQPHNQKEGAVDPIDMQKAFVEWAQEAWEGIVRALDFEQNDYKRRHFSENLRLVRMRAAATPAESPNYALLVRSL